jgi:phage-related protein
MSPERRPVAWIGDSKKVLSDFPADVQSEVGYAIYEAECGGKHPNAKPMHGDLSGVMEIVSDSENGNTYRAVYTIKLNHFLYVLHCFEKKAKHGIATPKRELDIIRGRIKAAREHNAKHVKTDAPRKAASSSRSDKRHR